MMKSTLFSVLLLSTACAAPPIEVVADAGIDEDKVGPTSLNCSGPDGQMSIRYLRSNRNPLITSTWGTFQASPTRRGDHLDLTVFSSSGVGGEMTISNYYRYSLRSRFVLRFSLDEAAGTMTCTAP